MNVLDQSHGRDWMLYNGDSCRVIGGIPDDSVDLIVHSPPFANLYIYSDSIADMGNSEDQSEFFDHYRFLIPHLKRITKPGRLCVVHCKDLPKYKNRDAAMGLKDFPGEVVRAFESCGWVFHSRVTIWKDPVTEMQRTKNHGLLYKELCKDSCGSRQGMADYLLVFRNWDGEFADPVTVGGERFGYYIGMEPPDAGSIAAGCGSPDGKTYNVRPDPKTGRWPNRNPFPEDSQAYRDWSIQVWQRYASPVWHDIDQMDVLNVRAARDDEDEKHICPLQLGLIERCVHLWSNPGDVVFSPFAGIGSELYAAVRAGRKACGIELKPAYFRQASGYLAGLEFEIQKPSLFDLVAVP